MSNPNKSLKKNRVDFNKNESINYNHISDSPYDLFNSWLEEAFLVDKDNANAFVLSTVSKDSLPSSRVVLLRGLSNDGLIFFTNYNSHKSLELSNNNNVSVNFFWPELEKQVRIKGAVCKISDQESDDYFDSRPVDSQLGAILSNQSEDIPLGYDLSEKLVRLRSDLNNRKIDRPEYWGGYLIKANYFEFWQGRPSRLHDRLCYTFINGLWKKSRKSP